MKPPPYVFFPNFTFRMLRSDKLAKNQVAFQVPHMLNKYDIKNYLQNVYQVKVEKVKTVNLIGKTRKTRYYGTIKKANFKKAIVTIDSEFSYPDYIDIKATEAHEQMKKANE